MKIKLLIIFVLILCPIYFNQGFSKIIFTQTGSEFKNAIPNLKPGDTLILKDGSYDLNSYVSVTVSGTEYERIVIKAQTTGGVKLINKSFFDIKAVSYITIEGFEFLGKDGTAIKMSGSSFIRITRNRFALTETASLKWVLVGGIYNVADAFSHHIRIDHNIFEEKHQLGNCITIDGSQPPTSQVCQYVQIDHNHFKNIGPRATNEMETIRVGWSEISNSDGYITIENNLFENCDGDPEFISVKSGRDTIRYNTFLGCQGTLCLRSGRASVINGNFFLGNGKSGTGGIRIYGEDHKIFNNYFSDLKGNNWDAPVTITNGDADSNSTDLTKHFRPKRIQVLFNTLIDNDYGIEIGFNNNGSYSKPPANLTFANNVVKGDKNQLVKYITTPTGIVWSSNIMFASGTAGIGVTLSENQIKVIDPLYMKNGGIYHLTGSSPAIDYSSGSFDYIKDDMDGQIRQGIKDAGADEYSALQIIRKPLTSGDVGPFANDLISNIESAGNILKDNNFELFQNFPNPFNPSTKIRYMIKREGNIKISVSDILGKEVEVLKNGSQESGESQIEWHPKKLSSGIYFVKMTDGRTQIIRKVFLMK